MKRLMIEQVDNGYVVTNKKNNDFSPCMVELDTGIHVFETFASMSKWLEGHFEPSKSELSGGWPEPLHLGDDET